MKRIFILLVFITFISCKQKETYIYLTGTAFGTTFNIKYKDAMERNMSKAIDSLVRSVNKSLSTYDRTSDISKINQGDKTVVVDEKFKEVFEKSKRIYIETNGVFDPTIGNLVNAWDFGPEKKSKNLDSITIKELMKQVGFNRVHLQHNKIIKENLKTYFDFNAIAKGYGVDIIGRFLEQKNIVHYMIEIGGEIRVRGKSPLDVAWKLGIEKPNFNGTQSVQKIISLTDEVMATSGTYRKFKIDENGNKYAHILDTRTGYPAKSNVLSATVIAHKSSKLDCADVDGYATTFIAMGLKKSKVFLKNHPELTVFLIYSDQNGELQTFQTDSF